MESFCVSSLPSIRQIGKLDGFPGTLELEKGEGRHNQMGAREWDHHARTDALSLRCSRSMETKACGDCDGTATLQSTKLCKNIPAKVQIALSKCSPVALSKCSAVHPKIEIYSACHSRNLVGMFLHYSVV